MQDISSLPQDRLNFTLADRVEENLTGDQVSRYPGMHQRIVNRVFIRKGLFR